MIPRRLICGLATGTVAATAAAAIGVPAASGQDPAPAATSTETSAPAAPPAAPAAAPAAPAAAPAAAGPPVAPAPPAPAAADPVLPLPPTPTAPAIPPAPAGVTQTNQPSTGTGLLPRPAGARRPPATTEDDGRPAGERAGAAAGDPLTGDLSLDVLGTPAVAVPDVLLRNFRIPPFLLSIYQAAGVQYGVPWEILAAINEIETDYGRNVAVSSAGAQGWMQFMPATWAQYGVDANRDGHRDPHNPVDAIFAAARYLKAAGAGQDLRRAIFAYNHAGWYVDSVLLRAKLIRGLPDAFVRSLTGLTQGRFPVHATATYPRGPAPGDGPRRSVTIVSSGAAPVLAVQDARVVALGATRDLGRYIRLRDVFGNTYTYAGLGEIARTYRLGGPVHETQDAAPRRAAPPRDGSLIALAAGVRARAHTATGIRGGEPNGASGIVAHPAGPAPDIATLRAAAAVRQARGGTPAPVPAATRTVRPEAPADDREAVPRPAPERVLRASAPAGSAFGPVALPAASEAPAVSAGAPTGAVPKATTEDGATARYRPQQPVAGTSRDPAAIRILKRGALVPSGTVIGRLKQRGPGAGHLRFAVRPAGAGSPRLDPTPLLDGWRLLETTAIFRAGSAAGLADGRREATPGQVLLLPKATLQRRVLSNPRVRLYPCGRQDIAAGTIDRRVLAVLEYLAASGLEPTVSSLSCGHGRLTATGNVSDHSSGNGVDIAAVNGVPILGHQGAGSITERTVQRLLELQGVVRPRQIISLMTVTGAPNTVALPDHADHIHLGFDPSGGDEPGLGAQAGAILAPGDWRTLGDRLAALALPEVRRTPSAASLPVAAAGKGRRR